MKCIEISAQKLVVRERDTPKPKRGEVLVKVHAAGINRPDILQRKGLYPPPPGVTDIPGLEIAGEIARSGGLFRSRRRGEKVCALVPGGAYAEYCIVPEELCMPIPRGMPYITAAGIPETFMTVWTNFFDSAKLKKGQTVLVHGGASGIGTAAIQIACAMKIRIIVTAGTDEKCASCRELGAFEAINYKDKDFVLEVMRVTDGYGVDAVIDMVGGDYVARNIKVLKAGGRHVSIAAQKNRKAEIDIMPVMTGALTLTGSTLRPRDVKEKVRIAKALQKNIWPFMHKQSAFAALFSKNRVKPVIDKTFQFAHAQEAHDYLESGVHVGKVILQVVPDNM